MADYCPLVLKDTRHGEMLGRDRNGGCMFIGSKGTIMCGIYGKDPYLIPESFAGFLSKASSLP